MLVLFKNYLLDFWLWWYWFNLKRVLAEIVKDWNFTIGYLNLVPMVKNIFRPMFQDNSWEGKLVAIPFRVIWSVFASVLLLIYTILLVVALLVYLALPLLPLIILLGTIFNK
jgi:hypothetical protein